MFKSIVANYYKDAIPRWMAGTRFERLMLLDKWLEGTFYDKIELAFDQERSGNTYNKISNRRPSVQHNFPLFIAGLSARKLFGGRHVPRLRHKDANFLLKVQALVEELHLPLTMLEAVKRGSVGSVAIMFKFLESQEKVKGVVEVKRAQNCTPTFNKFKELTAICEHYLIYGYELIQRDMTRDREGREIDPNLKYWFVKKTDLNEDCIYFPLAEHDWNPVNSGVYVKNPADALIPYPFAEQDNPVKHDLGFIQAIWVQNMVGGQWPDGISTFESGLNNFIEIDYARSQNGRGLKYGSAPQLVIKGNLREEVEGDATGVQHRDPAYVIRLASDEKTMDQSASSGHDAFLLQTDGNASKASDDYVRQLKQTTFEQICAARKDMESIKGAISGKAIELIDEDFLDLLQELRLQYGTCGYLNLVKKLCKAAAQAGHELMAGMADMVVDGLTIEYPPMYLPDPQELQFLISGLVEATNTVGPPGPSGPDGKSQPTTIEPILDPAVASEYLARQMDLVEASDDRVVLPETTIDPAGQPDPQPMTPMYDEAAPGGALTDTEKMLTDGFRREPIQ